MRPEAGPIHPNPEAIVLISTCFQQQYGDPLSQGCESNIKSERIIPNCIGYVFKQIINMLIPNPLSLKLFFPTLNSGSSILGAVLAVQK